MHIWYGIDEWWQMSKQHEEYERYYVWVPCIHAGNRFKLVSIACYHVSDKLILLDYQFIMVRRLTDLPKRVLLLRKSLLGRRISHVNHKV